ncbi:putative cathepsin-like thiol protease [Cryptosporidium canis]|uniref:Cathepsin-like thiol protease n=1 Tax=Cryptosporidium canis TaxID=195482 RepID=A0ABQ8P377_9CRYT|nr:putative cathepsin-like thiol protease [Cryptosporidium canis]KAJ1606518.1 putative cathepsin-like thiol protease [Cryptosporidium canis]
MRPCLRFRGILFSAFAFGQLLTLFWGIPCKILSRARAEDYSDGEMREICRHAWAEIEKLGQIPIMDFEHCLGVINMVYKSRRLTSAVCGFAHVERDNRKEEFDIKTAGCRARGKKRPAVADRPLRCTTTQLRPRCAQRTRTPPLHTRRASWGAYEDPWDVITDAIYNYGPVTVSICSLMPGFNLYSGGFYEPPTCGSIWCGTRQVDHAVTLVGYGVSTQGKRYYILKNSWGVSWGNKGFMNISADMCSTFFNPGWVTSVTLDDISESCLKREPGESEIAHDYII